jgi:hypothetical protein
MSTIKAHASKNLLFEGMLQIHPAECCTSDRVDMFTEVAYFVHEIGIRSRLATS